MFVARKLASGARNILSAVAATAELVLTRRLQTLSSEGICPEKEQPLNPKPRSPFRFVDESLHSEIFAFLGTEAERAHKEPRRRDSCTGA